MVFPGVLRGRPGPRLATILTNRPRRSLSSPRMSAALSVAASERTTRGGERKRRGPGPLEEPAPSGPKAFSVGWRGLTPQWPRSLRLGSASGFKVARAPAMQAPRGQRPRTFRKKPSAPGGARRARRTREAAAGAPHAREAVRQRLRLLPQWTHGQRRLSRCDPPAPPLAAATPAGARAGGSAENPFGEPPAATAAAEAQELRKRIGSALAGDRGGRSRSSSRRSKARCCCCRTSSC